MKNNKYFFNPNLLDILLIINQIQIISCISYTKGTILKANHNYPQKTLTLNITTTQECKKALFYWGLKTKSSQFFSLCRFIIAGNCSCST